MSIADLFGVHASAATHKTTLLAQKKAAKAALLAARDDNKGTAKAGLKSDTPAKGTGSGKSAGTTTTGFDARVRQARARGLASVAAQASADGKVPAPVRTGPSTELARHTRRGVHRGSRDRKIEHLEGQISDIKKGGIVNALPGLIPGFGHVAKAVANSVTGDDKKDAKLAKQKLQQLHTESTLNFMADTLYALGAPQQAVDAIDGAQKISVVPDSSMPSDAEFDSESNDVRISQSLMNKVAADKEKLEAQGIVNDQGEILNKDRLNASPLKENAVKTGSLLVHESVHARQDASGSIETFEQLNAKLRQRILAAGAASNDKRVLNRLTVAADKASNLLRDRILEYDAYHTQEVTQIAAGAPGKIRVTLAESGGLLPLEQAVANIAAFENNTPLPYGPDAGVRKSDFDRASITNFSSAIKKALAAAKDDAAVDSRPRSKDTDAPGKKWPGAEWPGKKWPGKKWPGEDFPGKKWPGSELPGKKWPGKKWPGVVVPGSTLPGTELPGKKWPGKKWPGEAF